MSHHLVGAAEVAALLGVTRQRVAQLAASGAGFPPPEVELAAGRIWTREAIEQWAAAHPDRGARAWPIGMPPPGDWPPGVRVVMDLAAELASHLNHHWLGPDHILLALLHPDCPDDAGTVLRSFGLTLEDVRDAYIASMGDPFEPHRRGLKVPPATQLLLEAAKRKAIELHDDAVRSEHVLLALTERWDRNPLTHMVAQRGVEAEEVYRRTVLATELVEKGEPEWPATPLGAWPDFDGPSRRTAPELAASLAGHDPWNRRSWGSVMFTDATGRTFRQGKAVRQYYVDRDGHPVRTTDGRPVHVLIDEDGGAVLDADGKSTLAPVEIPPGCEVVPARP